MEILCRDCGALTGGTETHARCATCGSGRLARHDELSDLHLAHIDCDAFYATIEKRDDPSIRGKPVIVGGERRGVVAAACYIARIKGVHSAMPMFEARKRCPKAVVIPPDMEKYRNVGREVRRLMEETTPLVEPLSIDEAFLDLSGTEKLHGGCPAQTLVRLIRRIEDEIGITASVGLSFNKFLAKVASDLDKPRGFSIIGRGDALDFLDPQPVSLIWGVGKALHGRLIRDGISTIGELRAVDEVVLVKRYGAIGQRLHAFSRARDGRAVEPESAPKSISAETTLDHDVADAETLERHLWRLAEKVSARMKAAGYAGGGVTLKLKQADFKLLTRSRQMQPPSQLADEFYHAARDLLRIEADGRHFRLIGIGAARLVRAEAAGQGDLLDPERAARAGVERAIDDIRARFGGEAIGRGRGFGER